MLEQIGVHVDYTGSKYGSVGIFCKGNHIMFECNLDKNCTAISQYHRVQFRHVAKLHSTICGYLFIIRHLAL